jgi:hypothetical protein
MREKEILEQAIRQFNNITGAVLQQLPAKKLEHRADAVVELRLGKIKARFWVEVKNELREQNMNSILNQIKHDPTEWLLICQYIPKTIKAELKNRAVNYLETAGNCFIRKAGLFFYINNQAVTKQRQPKEGKLWKQAGLKFLFGVLVKPELLNEPYRTIAKKTNVALGNIGAFIEELKQEGFIKEGIKNKNKFLFIENKEQLQNRWVEFYNALLKPKLKQGTFRFIDKKMIREWEFLPGTDFYWGGEPAGAKLTNFLVPEQFTIYTREVKTKIMQQLKLAPDATGNIEIIEKFWDDELNYQQGIVPPLLAYAELINSTDSRNRETAERIKQKYLG